MKADLESIATRVRNILRRRDADGFELASLVLEAKEHGFTGDGIAWENWCKDQFNFERRYCYLLAKVADTWRYLLANNPTFSAAAALTFGVACALSPIPRDRVVEFLSATPDLSKMSRDDLRKAVQKFLGRDPDAPMGQQDFFGKLNLPAPAQFRDQVQKSLATMPAGLSADYGSILLHAAVQKRDQLSPADRRQILTNLATFSADLLERDATPFIQHFTKLL